MVSASTLIGGGVSAPSPAPFQGQALCCYSGTPVLASQLIFHDAAFAIEIMDRAEIRDERPDEISTAFMPVRPAILMSIARSDFNQTSTIMIWYRKSPSLMSSASSTARPSRAFGLFFAIADPVVKIRRINHYSATSTLFRLFASHESPIQCVRPHLRQLMLPL